MALAAPDKLLVDFGLRRAHRVEAGLLAARASYIAGFDGTATMMAGKLWDIPLYGTMAHSFIETYHDEAQAFEDFARSRPDRLVILLDTYDTEAVARKVVALAPRLQASGIKVGGGVRLDSGDLVVLARSVRRILDKGGLNEVTIFASGGLDEDDLMEFARRNALYGRRGSARASPTEGRSRATAGWRRRPGRADPSRASKACPKPAIRGCGQR
jgi:nicotinate phosphoribosyltransferase